MRLRFSYGLPVLRRDFRLRRILAVRIWLCLLLFYRMCNRIQGRTPVFLTWTFGISYDPSDVVSEVVSLFPWFEFGCDWGSIRLWFLNWFLVVCYSDAVNRLLLKQHLCWFGIDQTLGFWNASLKCSWLTLKWIIVVVRTFSCWSDFNMRASVKHELLGHGFHDELFN